MISIRRAARSDFDQILEIFQAVIEAGDSYSHTADTTLEEAFEKWMSPRRMTYVAEENETIVGVYTITANHPGRGSHVANASYIVRPTARGRRIGRMLGEHSIEEAKKAGYAAMQFNIVVSTNRPAVELWKKLGFSIIGTSPKAFNHKELGFVDTYIMHRFL
jgi:L-amino acid N-acyltransferase YncA